MTNEILYDISIYLKEKQFNVSYKPKNENTLFNELTVSLNKEFEGKTFKWNLQILHVTERQDFFEKNKLLQFFVPLSVIQNKEITTSLISFLNTVNSKMILGHFGFLENDNLLYFKYNAIISLDFNINSFELLVDQVNTISLQLLMYKSAFDGILVADK